MKKLFKLTSVAIATILTLTTICLSIPAYGKSIESEINGVINLNDTTTEVRLISFDEMIKEIAYHENKSIDIIRNRFIEEKKMEMSANSDITVLSTLQSTSYITVKVGGFPTLKGTYQPKGLSFYGEGSSPGFDKYLMTRILHIVLDRSNAIGSGSKQFTGNVFAHLELTDRIYYSVDGDFYNNGTTNFSGGVDIKIGEYVTLPFSISNSSNHFSYMYHSGRWNGRW